jgi:hypothetical protein
MSRHRGWRAVAAVGLLAVVIIAALGGFGRHGGRNTVYPIAGVGQRVDAGALAVTPLCAWVASGKPGRLPNPFDKGRYLILRLRVENLTESGAAATAYLQDDVVWLADGKTDQKEAAQLQRADDHSFGVQLQPRLPTVVDLVWELPGGVAPRQPAVWGVFRRERVERTYLTNEQAWIQGKPDTKLRLQAGDACTQGRAS